jgi:hypothetical protein
MRSCSLAGWRSRRRRLQLLLLLLRQRVSERVDRPQFREQAERHA